MTNIEIIDRFFTAFGNLNDRDLNALYSDDVIYSDPLFGLLQGQQVKEKWELVCKSVKELQLTVIKKEEIDHEYATCQWKAEYVSASTGKPVIFYSKSFMRFADGRITEHSEGFRLTQWIAQVYGIKGRLFGWLNFMKRKVQAEYQERLNKYSKSKVFFETGKKRRHISDSFDQ
ncbi:cyclase [Niabella ginsenosidivorans]|uniref:Cyclase n=1 Tax=Niabella ginsenosidivorans TaxID=1176587 RepID=A0A1A9I2B1_9BACT|nr:nuclear transport factor 2 family protein [Niabella ginsenosidivorans]ANH80850.1 cyclase [Niabella ginsenosidivorans]